MPFDITDPSHWPENTYHATPYCQQQESLLFLGACWLPYPTYPYVRPKILYSKEENLSSANINIMSCILSLFMPEEKGKGLSQK